MSLKHGVLLAQKAPLVKWSTITKTKRTAYSVLVKSHPPHFLPPIHSSLQVLPMHGLSLLQKVPFVKWTVEQVEQTGLHH